MLLDLNQNLHGNKETILAMTHKGMAHFAGTGPAGATCGKCEHHKPGYEKARTKVCLKARRLGVRCGSAIPATAAACKYFEAAETPA